MLYKCLDVKRKMRKEGRKMKKGTNIKGRARGKNKIPLD
jgi:hypothetical protein